MNNFQSLQIILENDIRNIWDSIYKPEEFRASKPSDFFNFEYKVLPHKHYEEAKFLEECKKLRSRFDTTASDTLFPT